MSMPVTSSNPTRDFFYQYFPTVFTIFLDGAELKLVFKAKSTTGDYHDEMNNFLPMIKTDLHKCQRKTGRNAAGM